MNGFLCQKAYLLITVGIHLVKPDYRIIVSNFLIYLAGGMNQATSHSPVISNGNRYNLLKSQKYFNSIFLLTILQ